MRSKSTREPQKTLRKTKGLIAILCYAPQSKFPKARKGNKIWQNIRFWLVFKLNTRGPLLGELSTPCLLQQVQAFICKLSMSAEPQTNNKKHARAYAIVVMRWRKKNWHGGKSTENKNKNKKTCAHHILHNMICCQLGYKSPLSDLDLSYSKRFPANQYTSCALPWMPGH